MIENYLRGNGILYNKNGEDVNRINLQQMSSESEQLLELKQLIREELKDCNRLIWPMVCEMQSTEQGLAKLEEMVIRYVAEEGMPVGSAIALIEQELSHIV